MMFGDSGAPTGQLPLYSGNDVMVGGVAGGDIMKGFSGDDIMLGHGSFTKFIGGLGFDWGSYELATQGVDEDMNRKEFVAANGAVDNVRDVWQHTEGASGSAFDDIMLGDNDTKLVTTKDELDNVNLITGLAGLLRSRHRVVRRRQHHAGWRRQRHHHRRRRQRHHRRRRLAACRADQLHGRRADHPPDQLRSEREHLRSGNGGGRTRRQRPVDPAFTRAPATSMPPTSTPPSSTTSWPTTTSPCSARMRKAS